MTRQDKMLYAIGSLQRALRSFYS